MKPSKITKKVAVKSAKVKATVARKVGKVAKALVVMLGLSAIVAGCATAEQPISNPALQAGKSQTQHVTLNHSQINVFVGATEASVDPTNTVKLASAKEQPFDVSVLSQAQALESSGTETYSPANSPTSTPTATPTNKIDTRLDAHYNDATQQATNALETILGELEPESRALVKSLVDSGKNGVVDVVKADGTKSSVICKDGLCSFCEDGSCTRSVKAE